MSIADRFPDLDLSLPDWLLNAPDEPFDTFDLARRSALEDLRALDPLAHAPSAVDLHLVGQGMQTGAVNSDVAAIFSLFQEEVDSASEADDKRLTTMRLVGSSPGSVVLHLAPIQTEVGEPDGQAFPIPTGRAFDAAVARVLDLHDQFERQRSIDLKVVKAPLRSAARRFIEKLDELEVTVEASVYTAEGHRRSSALTRRGRAFAATQFDPVEESRVDLISGVLQSVDLTGRIVVRGRGGRRAASESPANSKKQKKPRLKNFEITGVPVEMIRTARLLPGQFYGVQVAGITARDPMKTKSREEFKFIGLASLDIADEDHSSDTE